MSLVSCEVLFYFFMPQSGSFYSSYPELVHGDSAKGFNLSNPVKYHIKANLINLALQKTDHAATDSTLNATAAGIYKEGYDEAKHKSKTYLFILLPVWSLLIFGIFYRKNSFYVPHLVFAMHLFSFFLLTDLVFLIFYFNILNLNIIRNDTHLLPFFIIVLVYFSMNDTSFNYRDGAVASLFWF